MKFFIDYISKSSGRLGHLVHAESGKQFKTPLLLQTTKGGSIPYLSREVFDYVTENVQLLQMSLATMDEMAEAVYEFKEGMATFCGFKGYPTMLMIRDPCEYMPSGFNEQYTVPLFTRRGNEQLSATKYMQIVEQFAPDIYQGLSDADTNLQSSKKRIQKSVDRTSNIMMQCYESHANSKRLQNSALFIPIVGGYSTHARTASISHALVNGKNLCAGYLLEGFHNYGVTATEVVATELVKIVELCLQKLGPEKPIMLPGAYTPSVIMKLISLGVDMFDTSYAYLAAVNFKALTFNFKLNKSLPADMTTPFLDITKDCFMDDFKPLLEDCKCLSCVKHHRAYINHLYKTKELLGPILLMIHNLHHFMEFFEAIRESMSNETFTELEQQIRLNSSASENNEIDYRIQVNESANRRNSSGKSQKVNEENERTAA